MVNNDDWYSKVPWQDAEHWSMDTSKISVKKLLDLLARKERLHSHSVKQKLHVKIAPHPFAAGRFRLAYHALQKVQMTDKQAYNMVVKRFRKGPHDWNLYVRQMELQSIGDIFAYAFNWSVAHRKLTETIMHVRFTKVETLRINGHNYDLEAYVPGTYIKYTNNAGDVNRQYWSNTLLAFSHWTYKISGGMLMVTDLQGVHHGNDFWLTDPAIHSSNYRFYDTDLGNEGMGRFFRSHRCNNCCRALGLNPHSLHPR